MEVKGSFIVRIYHRERGSGVMMGIVERAGEDGKKAFKSGEELLDILRSSSLKGKRNTGPKKKS